MSEQAKVDRGVDIVLELQKGDAPLTKEGAALMLAHLLVEVGAKRVASMSPDAAREYCATFVSRHPMIHSAVAMGHVGKFVKVCKMYGLTVESPEHYAAEITRLLPAPTAAMRAVAKPVAA